jgi:hypothetical protein
MKLKKEQFQQSSTTIERNIDQALMEKGKWDDRNELERSSGKGRPEGVETGEWQVGPSFNSFNYHYYASPTSS